MSCSLYSLLSTNQDRTRDETFRLDKTLRNLELTSKDRKFSGEDPILTFDFLTRFVEPTLEISEGQIMALLPKLLSGSTGDQQRATENGSRPGNSGSIIRWLEAD